MCNYVTCHIACFALRSTLKCDVPSNCLIMFSCVSFVGHPAPPGHPQDYAGKTFLFVERPPERLICAVCQAPAHDPVQANCCGNVYCTQCIEKWKARSNSCPNCRSTEQSDPPFALFKDRRVQQEIRCLVVFCPNWKDGCDKKMDLIDVDNHLTSDNGCPF